MRGPKFCIVIVVFSTDFIPFMFILIRYNGQFGLALGLVTGLTLLDSVTDTELVEKLQNRTQLILWKIKPNHFFWQVVWAGLIFSSFFHH